MEVMTLVGGIVAVILLIKIFQLCNNAENILRMLKFYIERQTSADRVTSDKAEKGHGGQNT